MNAVWNSYGQLCGCPEIFKKSCKFFCRELDIRVSQIVEADMSHFLVPKKLPKACRNPIPPFWQPIGFCQYQIVIIIPFSGCSKKLFLFFLLHFMTPEIGKNGVCQRQCAFSSFYRCHFLNFRNRSW